jgi:very-short-patch-repair endonuclease
MDGSSAQRWLQVAALAATQHGRVTTAQLHEAGVSRGAVDRAVAAGRLHRVHTGVFAVGHVAPSMHAGWMGAVLSCGDGAALSHRSATTLFGIRRAQGPRIDVTVPSRNGRERRDVRIHRSPLTAAEVTTRDGIRVTTVARTIADVAHEIDRDALASTVREAQFLGLFDLRATRLAAARRPSRALLELLEDMTPASSKLDAGFVELIRRHRLPMPLPQTKLLGHKVDYVWEAQRVAVELDGYNAHVSLDAFQRDRSQGNALLLAGWLLLRFTWADVHRRPAATVATIRQALGGNHI